MKSHLFLALFATVVWLSPQCVPAADPVTDDWLAVRNQQPAGLHLTLTLPKSFEKPGTYQVYARSSRVQPGEKDALVEQMPPAVNLVSDPITITIDPLTADKEKAIIDQAEQTLAAAQKRNYDDPPFQAMQRLRYLQTPAAYDILLRFMDSPMGYQAMLGLYASPD